jgi:iron(III) transport system ATP-binding protein
MADVRIEQVHKHYGSHHALKGVSLDIASGSFFTLLGPSGCGKTTLLRAMAGFHFQDSGDILVDGRSFGRTHAAQRNVGMVFQDYAIFPHLSVFDNVAFGLVQQKRPRAEIAERVADMLAMVQLANEAQRMPHQLSGGQQQRVGLARALVIRPQILLMDEPLSNLDAKLRIELRQDIRRMQQQLGLTTIYVTHDQEEALSVSDLVCVMDAGEVQQVGRPWDIYYHPANRFVASFVGANHFVSCPVDQGRVRWLGREWAVPVGAAAAREVVLSLRPERVRVNTRGVGIPAELLHSVFTGRELQLRLRCDGQQVFDALVQPDQAMVALKPADTVHIDLQPGDFQWFATGARGARFA